jgi:hypothetical protein
MVVAVEPSMSTETVVVPDTENGLEVKVRVASLTQNGKPAPPLEELEDELLDELLDEELELLEDDDELELEELLDEELDEDDVELEDPVFTVMPYKQ